jgi:hypothetical protein
VIHLRDGRISRNAFFRATAVLALASLLGFVVGTPFSLIDFRGFADGLRFDAHHLATGHGIVLGRGWVYHSTFSLWYALGPPLLFTSIGGLALLTARSWRRAVVVGIFPVLYFLAIGRGYTVFVRYIIPVVPFLCIAGAVAIAAAAKGLAPRIRVPAAVLATAAALLLSIPSAVRAIAFDRIISRPDTRLLAAAWIDARLQPAEWIGEVSPASLHPSFGRAPGVRVASFDSPRGVFLSDGGETVTPTWIALAQSPLSVYNTVPSEVVNSVASDYTLAETFLATRGPEAPAWFDQQDMFFVPYATLSMRDRPGPDIRIYRHRE